MNILFSNDDTDSKPLEFHEVPSVTQMHSAPQDLLYEGPQEPERSRRESQTQPYKLARLPISATYTTLSLHKRSCAFGERLMLGLESLFSKIKIAIFPQKKDGSGGGDSIFPHYCSTNCISRRKQ